MRLVFVHGWAFGPESFDALAPLLAEWPQARADLGFFGAPRLPDLAPDDVLIGHSLGFSWGLSQKHNWAAAVAINGFARFVLDDSGRGCVRPAELRALRKALARDPRGCTNGFRARHGGGAAPGAVLVESLAAGLDFLESYDACISPLAAEGDPKGRMRGAPEQHFLHTPHPSRRFATSHLLPQGEKGKEDAMFDEPRLILAAQDDPLVPLDASRELAQTAAQRAASASGGHGLPWTAPDFCAANIRDFLRRPGLRRHGC